MGIDEIIARIEGSAINVHDTVDINSMSNWEVACLIGKTVSLALYGYEDHYDAVDWTEAAREICFAAKHEGEVFTRRSILKALDEMAYNLEDYA